VSGHRVEIEELEEPEAQRGEDGCVERDASACSARSVYAPFSNVLRTTA
jgi:hypothetical protein